MTTFGDMLAVADARRERIVHAFGHLDMPDIEQQARHPSTLVEVARLTRVLGRCADQVAAGFGVPHAEGTDVKNSARQTSRLLSEALQQLEAPEQADVEGSDMALNLKVAALSLGCGLDLLSSHLPPSHHDNASSHTNATTSENAGVISAADTARWLLFTTGQHASTAGRVVMRTGDPTSRRAGMSLIKASLVAHMAGQKEAAPINALTLNRLPERSRPATGESLNETVRGIAISAQRLRTTGAAEAVTTWRYLAHSAAFAYEVGTLLTVRLAQRLKDFDDLPAALALHQSRTSLSDLSRRWRTIARQWRSLSDTGGVPTSTLAVDASDLVLRLGRLTYDDPEWAPSRRATHKLIPAERSMPGPVEAGLVGTALLHAIDACATAAGRHHGAVNDIAALGTLRSSRSASVNRLPAPARDLLDRYTTVHREGLAAVAQLATALQRSTAVLPDGAREVALVLHRVRAAGQLVQEGSDVPGPAALAHADFPAPIATAISATQHALEGSGQRPGLPSNENSPRQATR
ncbi:hypothetical protein SMC26_24070 [Actinomadura fulvescens]|uniref:Uncharacterized protein n=1 Tax=Actinomadura fulvescens TaxID=46160 RepID=A0ABN3Q3D3_9ACTN